MKHKDFQLKVVQEQIRMTKWARIMRLEFANITMHLAQLQQKNNICKYLQTEIGDSNHIVFIWGEANL